MKFAKEDKAKVLIQTVSLLWRSRAWSERSHVDTFTVCGPIPVSSENRPGWSNRGIECFGSKGFVLRAP
jgi:hypothetical protein